MTDLRHKIRTRWGLAPNTIVAAEQQGTAFQDFVCDFIAMEDLKASGCRGGEQ